MNKDIKKALYLLVAFTATFVSATFIARTCYESEIEEQKLENIRLSIRNDSLTTTNEILIEENDKMYWQLKNIEPSNDK